MLSRLNRVIIWKYADDVPIERLRRHHRIASRICMIGVGSGALMTSSLAEFLASREGWGRTISMVVLFTSGSICGLMMIPSIFAWAWGEEIENEFTERGLPLPNGGRMRKWLPRTAMKTFYWFIGIAIIVYVAQSRR